MANCKHKNIPGKVHHHFTCMKCGKSICSDCATIIGHGQVHCKQCAKVDTKAIVEKK